MFWTGLNKTENFEKTQKAIHSWQISHFLLKSIKNIKKFYVFWNGLNKTEIFEKTQKDIYSLCFFKTNGLLNGKSQETIDFLQTSTMADFQKKNPKKIFKKSLKKL